MNDKTEIDLKRRKRTGPSPVIDPRRTLVGVRLNDLEIEHVDAQRGALKRAEWLRCAALNKLTPPAPKIPALNLEAWRSLGRIGGNINQSTRNINLLMKTSSDKEEQMYSSALKELSELSSALKEFRSKLLTGNNLFDHSDPLDQ